MQNTQFSLTARKTVFFQNLINQGCGIKMSWVENFLKINNQGGGGDVFSIKEKFKTRTFQ